jgi:hypothetical protein
VHFVRSRHFESARLGLAAISAMVTIGGLCCKTPLLLSSGPARSGWAEEVDHLVTVDKVELGKGETSLRQCSVRPRSTARIRFDGRSASAAAINLGVKLGGHDRSRTIPLPAEHASKDRPKLKI